MAVKVIQVNNKNITLDSSVTFRGSNILFVNGGVLRIYELRKQGGINSLNDNLLIVGYNGAKIFIDDQPNESNSGTNLDLVQAGILVFDTGEFKILQGYSADSALGANRNAYKDTGGQYDRLVLQGFVFSETLPVLERDLVLSNNRRYPAEWIIYDANLLYKLSDYISLHKIQTYKCGYVNHPHCQIH